MTFAYQIRLACLQQQGSLGYHSCKIKSNGSSLGAGEAHSKFIFYGHRKGVGVTSMPLSVGLAWLWGLMAYDYSISLSTFGI